MSHAKTDGKGDGTALLQKERARASFDSRAMTYFLDGGQAKTERNEEIRSFISSEPLFSNRNVVFLDRTKRFELSLERYLATAQIVLSHGLNKDPNEAWELYREMGDLFAIGTHNGMFVPNIESLGTDEQKAKWLTQARMMAIVGCYAQTEMGHGSNVRGLETVATYDKNTDEFVLNSPTLTSMKWWPGGLGVSSTHCVTQAHLTVGDQDCGIQTFIVQIRDMETHAPMKGIKVGDIGPKFGFAAVDNGYLMFDHVRIPRDQMLARYCKVSRDGVFSREERVNHRVSYVTMMQVRNSIIRQSADYLGRACTIAIRYSAVRRQFGHGEDGPEVQVLDYQMQRYRLLPLLAATYAFHFTAARINNLVIAMRNGIKDGDFGALPEAHATLSGLKALTTWVSSDGIEECRKACGGHGYSSFSGLDKMFADWVPACTYEGDNVVLCLQTARFLMKARENARRLEPLAGSVRYLESGPNTPKRCPFSSPSDFLKLEALEEVSSHRARYLVDMVSSQLDALIEAGTPMEVALNAVMADNIRMVKAHSVQYLVSNFVDVLRNGTPDASLRAVLEKLCALYALHAIEQNMGDLYDDGYFIPAHANAVRIAVRGLLEDLRTDAVALVDALNYSDQILNSSLGRYDGNVYEDMFQRAQDEPLNKPEGWKAAYENHIKPMMSMGAAILKSRL